MALPVESDPITLAKQIATLDHLSGGRVEIGAGFGWNTDELADHHVPAAKRRTVLQGVRRGDARAVDRRRRRRTTGSSCRSGRRGPSPSRPHHIPLIIGAGGGPKTFAWIAANADGWMTTPTQSDISGQIEALKKAWADAGRDGAPEIRILIAFKPDPDDLMAWAEAGATELIWGVPDKAEDEVLGSLDRLAGRLGISG